MYTNVENSVMTLISGKEFNQKTSLAMKKAVRHELDQGLAKVEINLKDVEFLDTAGIKELLAMQKFLQDQQVLFHLINPHPAVQQMLSLTRSDETLTILFRAQKKKAILPLFVFIDACGWEIVKNVPFLAEMAPHRRKLRSVFGYSSACIPSILSGRWPEETRNWSYFVRDPGNSPFRSLKILQWLPKFVTSRRRFRRYLSRLLRRPLKFRGYFDLYNIPFRHISLFDFTEKKCPLEPGGLNRGPNIFDHFEENGIPYHVSVPTRTEEQSLRALQEDISAQNIDFAFLYWPGLDGLMHETGNQSPRIGEKLAAYEEWLKELLVTANQHYEEVRLFVFSDHGMANCDHLLDLRAVLNQLPLQMPRDYTVVYDSTMARFWFENENSRKLIVDALRAVDQGRIIEDSELQELGTFFADRYFGELIFLVSEGVLIIPSDMGERPLRGMHGYHPDDAHSYATLMSNIAGISGKVTDIPHVFQLMMENAEMAHQANQTEEFAIGKAATMIG